MPNQGVPVIFKNKIAYGYAEKSVQAYDVSVSDYNALTEQQQLDGSIRFIQGVNAIPNGNNVWAKLGTTPLAEGLPRDCSQAVNELKSNLTNLNKVKTTGTAILGLNDAGTDYTIQKQGVVTITATLGSGADPYIRFIINSIRRWQVYSGNYSIAHVYDMSFPVFADDVVSFAHNRASAVTVTFYELN